MIQKTGEFEYDFDQKSVLDTTDIERRVIPGEITKYSIDRMRLYKKAKETAPEKIPKELARIIEQTLIPVYMDGTQRPPRKCRLISS